eukprot:gene17271-22805_t
MSDFTDHDDSDTHSSIQVNAISWAESTFNKIVPKESFDGSSNASNYTILNNTDLDSPLVHGYLTKSDDDIDKSANVTVENSPALTIFLLINTMIGSGILNQPYVFYQSGIFGGVIGYILASSMTWLGLNLLTAAGVKAKIYEYGNLTKFALGRKGEILIDISIIVGCFGALLGYILVVGSTLSELLNSWGCNNNFCGLYLTTIISVSAFVTPICLLRHFGHLALLSLFSVFAILCVLFLVLIGGPILSRNGSVQYFNISGTVKSLGSIVFSLSCASANFQAFITTQKTARNRVAWMGITGYVVSIGSFMCVAMGIAGYLSFKDLTDGIILDNFEGPQFDFFKVMVATHLILYIPVNFIIMRYSIIKLALNKRLASGDAFSIILDLTGGISGSITSFILPAWIFINVCTNEDALWWPAKINLALGDIQNQFNESIKELVNNGWDEFIARQALLAQWTLDQRKAQGKNDTFDRQLVESIRPTLHRNNETTANTKSNKKINDKKSTKKQPQVKRANKEDCIFEINSSNFQKLVLDNKVPVLLDLYADWCGPCKQLGPILEEAAMKSGGMFHLAKVNVDLNRDIVDTLGVTGFPTVFAFNKGKVTDRFVGLLPNDELQQFLVRTITGYGERNNIGDNQVAVKILDIAGFKPSPNDSNVLELSHYNSAILTLIVQ